MPGAIRARSQIRGRQTSGRAGGSLSPVETEFVSFFVGAARALKLPKSLGEIYGLLFASGGPRGFDEIVTTLRISRGSASQGLRVLRGFGAVRTTYVAGDRRDHYVAETELRKLVTGLLEETIAPQLAAGTERLDRLEGALRAEPVARRRASAHAILQGRLEKLRAWERITRETLPMLGRLLGA